MAETKKKPTAVKQKKGKIVGFITMPGAEPVSDEQAAEQSAFWKDTIQSLKSQHYQSMDQAIHAVVGAAMEKLGQTDDESGEVREFLYDVLNMDPELLEELEKSLDIRD